MAFNILVHIYPDLERGLYEARLSYFEPCIREWSQVSHKGSFLVCLFAHDCVCYREIRDSEDSLNLWKDIDRLGCWAEKWGIGLNSQVIQWIASFLSKTGHNVRS